MTTPQTRPWSYGFEDELRLYVKFYVHARNCGINTDYLLPKDVVSWVQHAGRMFERYPDVDDEVPIRIAEQAFEGVARVYIAIGTACRLPRDWAKKGGLFQPVHREINVCFETWELHHKAQQRAKEQAA
ncbi:hypothetical protein K6W36_09040 [Acetobacter senegalensis]|uniref:hypothetical protein n=1 Tax=Acetobacter senegalensis TaxID=446692 RepID=UPI001EDC2328|nr:hypothetical protein [Acetobacter senegalensis]MCG4260730.1 hypothetical protein [Acetobacter senegalensis]